jgi:hypothetical protein
VTAEAIDNTQRPQRVKKVVKRGEEGVREAVIVL